MPSPRKQPIDVEPAVFDTRQLSVYIGVPVETIRSWRSYPDRAPKGFPEAFLLTARRPVYLRAEVDAWLVARKAATTGVTANDDIDALV